MRFFAKKAVSGASGLTGGQIDQLNSRWAVSTDALTVGVSRFYRETDLYRYIVAGELARLGLDQSAVARVWAAMPLIERDPHTFEPIGSFPASGYLVILPDGDAKDFRAVVRFTPKDGLPRVLSASKKCAAIILDASKLRDRVDGADAVTFPDE